MSCKYFYTAGVVTGDRRICSRFAHSGHSLYLDTPLSSVLFLLRGFEPRIFVFPSNTATMRLFSKWVWNTFYVANGQCFDKMMSPYFGKLKIIFVLYIHRSEKKNAFFEPLKNLFLMRKFRFTCPTLAWEKCYLSKTFTRENKKYLALSYLRP
jgi:hypothetical protein